MNSKWRTIFMGAQGNTVKKLKNHVCPTIFIRGKYLYDPHPQRKTEVVMLGKAKYQARKNPFQAC